MYIPFDKANNAAVIKSIISVIWVFYVRLQNIHCYHFTNIKSH